MEKIWATFNNLKVSMKIAIGFAAVLVIMIFISGAGYVGISHVGTDFEDIHSASRSSMP